MKKILFLVLFMVNQTGNTSEIINWPSGIKDECRKLFLAYEHNDISYIRKFDQLEDKTLRESCKPFIGRYAGYKDNYLYYSCNALYEAVNSGALDSIKLFDKEAKQKEREQCMRYAVRQKSTSQEDRQFRSFKYVVKRLISLKLDDQQEILNELLAEFAIIYLSIDPRYTEYMLSVGADYTLPTTHGESVLITALWIVNDLGSCTTPRLIINKMSPKDFSIQYRTSVVSATPIKGVYSTPLMDSVRVTPYCSSERILIANKAININKQDNLGNTVLHYLYNHILDVGIQDDDLLVLKILLKKGASLKVKNKKWITPYHLRSKLIEELPEKCDDHCDKI